VTIVEFLAHLEATPREWRIDRGGFIRAALPVVPPGDVLRRSPDGFCPLAAVALHTLGRTFYNSDFSGAGRALGLDDDEIAHIVNAADRDTSYMNSEEHATLRRELLRACGLLTDDAR
jgi:hypothetical protein